MREAATLIATSVLGTDGDAASALACQLFDSVMEAEGVGVPSATVYDGPREGAIEATVRRVVGDVDGTDESLARFVDRVQQLVEREARLAASSTVERNVERAAKTKTGRRVRFARVPTSSVPCAWCAMLASRGFVYKSAESAEAGSHHHCTCTIVPGVQGKTRVAGYDTEHYADVWLNRERYESVAASAQPSDDAFTASLGARRASYAGYGGTFGERSQETRAFYLDDAGGLRRDAVKVFHRRTGSLADVDGDILRLPADRASAILSGMDIASGELGIEGGELLAVLSSSLEEGTLAEVRRRPNGFTLHFDLQQMAELAPDELEQIAFHEIAHTIEYRFSTYEEWMDWETERQAFANEELDLLSQSPGSEALENALRAAGVKCRYSEEKGRIVFAREHESARESISEAIREVFDDGTDDSELIAEAMRYFAVHGGGSNMIADAVWGGFRNGT